MGAERTGDGHSITETSPNSDYSSNERPCDEKHQAQQPKSSPKPTASVDYTQYKRVERETASKPTPDRNLSNILMAGVAFAVILLLLHCYPHIIQLLPSPEPPKRLSEIKSLYPIENDDHYFKQLTGLKRDYLYTGDILVLTFAGFISGKSEEQNITHWKFRKFKSEIIKSFLNATSEPRSILANGDMSSKEFDEKIKIARGFENNLIWVEDFLKLQAMPLQLLRKYTDAHALNAEKYTLVVLSFEVENENGNWELEVSDYMRKDFGQKFIRDEVEPYLARVALNIIEYRPRPGD